MRLEAVTPHHAFAAASLAIAGAGVLERPTGGTAALVAVAVPVAIAGVLVATGRRFSALEPTGYQVWVAAIVLAGGGTYGAGFVAFIEWVQGTPLLDAWYVIAMGGSGGVALATGITHYYVSYEQRLGEADAESARAARLQKQVSVLNRVLQHNIRNELTIIVGWLGRVDADDPERSERAAEIATEHLDKLLDLSETSATIQSVIDSGTTTAVDLAASADTAIDTVETTSPTLSVESDLPASAPVRAHPRVERAILETLENVAEHNDPSTVVARVSVRKLARSDGDGTGMDGGYAVAVSDDGDGIPDIEVNALDASEETALGHGQGLGLFFVKTIVDISDGEFTVRTNDDGGTTVTMLFPPAGVPEATDTATPVDT